MDPSDRTREGDLACGAGAFRVGKSLSQTRKCIEGATRNAGIPEVTGQSPRNSESAEIGGRLFRNMPVRQRRATDSAAKSRFSVSRPHLGRELAASHFLSHVHHEPAVTGV